MDSTAVSIFVVLLVELTNTVFVNSTITPSNIETAVLSRGLRRGLTTMSRKWRVEKENGV